MIRITCPTKYGSRLASAACPCWFLPCALRKREVPLMGVVPANGMSLPESWYCICRHRTLGTCTYRIKRSRTTRYSNPDPRLHLHRPPFFLLFNSSNSQYCHIFYLTLMMSLIFLRSHSPALIRHPRHSGTCYISAAGGNHVIRNRQPVLASSGGKRF